MPQQSIKQTVTNHYKLTSTIAFLFTNSYPQSIIENPFNRISYQLFKQIIQVSMKSQPHRKQIKISSQSIQPPSYPFLRYDLGSVMKDGFHSQATLMTEMILLLKNVVETQNTYLPYLLNVVAHKNNADQPKQAVKCQIQVDDAGLKKQAYQENRTKVSKFKKNLRIKKIGPSVQRSEDELSEKQHSESQVINNHEKNCNPKKLHKNQEVQSGNNRQLWEKDRFQNQTEQSNIASKITEKIKPHQRQNNHLPQKDLTELKVPIQKDYKDSLQQIKLAFIEKSKEIQKNQNKIETENSKISQKNQYKLKNQTFKKLDVLNTQSTIRKWIAQMMHQICITSYHNYLLKNTNEKEAKIYFTRNYIYNYIKARQTIKQLPHKQEIERIFLEMFQKQSIQCLKFLKLKYPQQQKTYVDKKIHELISVVDQSKSFNKYVIREMKFNDGVFGWRYIKELINYLIQQTNEYSQTFEQSTSCLFRQNDECSSTNEFLQNISFAINTKIKPNTPQYTTQELVEQGLVIKSPQLMRIVIKWIQSLEQLMNYGCQTYFTKNKGKYNSQIYNQIHKKFIQAECYCRNFQISQNHSQTQENQNQPQQYDPRKNQKEFETKTIKKFFQQMLDIMNSCSSTKFESIPKGEADIGIFTSMMTSRIQSLVSQHLFNLLHYLRIFSQIVPEFKQLFPTFPIFDLFRAKCSGTFQSISRVYNNFRTSSKFKIIKVKNRIDTPNRDFLINMMVPHIDGICELQLHVLEGKDKMDNQLESYKSKCSNSFNHFLYQLQRSKYGSIAESVILYENQDDIPSFFSLDKLNKNIKQKKQKRNLDYKVSITDSYDLSVEGYKLLGTQLIDIFCSQCSLIYKSYTFSVPYAVKQSQNITICSNCLFSNLPLQEIKKFNLKEFHKYFVSVEQSNKRFDQDHQPDSLSEQFKFVIKVKKFTKHIQTYKFQKTTLKQAYISSICEIIPQHRVKQFTLSKSTLKDNYIYVLKDPSSLCFTKVSQIDNSWQELLSTYYFNILKKSKNKLGCLVYLKHQAEQENKASTMIIDFYSKGFDEKQDWRIDYKEFKSQVQECCDQKTQIQSKGCLTLSGSKNNYHPKMFIHLPQKLKQIICSLDIFELRENDFVLDLPNLRYLATTIVTNSWGQSHLRKHRLPILHSLDVKHIYPMESVNFRCLNFPQLKNISLFCQSSIQQLLFEGNTQIFKALNRKPNAKNTQVPLPSLVDLRIETSQNIQRISFRDLKHQNLKTININSTISRYNQKQQENMIKVLDFRDSVLPQLNCLLFESKIGVQSLEGFGQKKNADIPELQIFKIAITNSGYLDVSALSFKKMKCFVLEVMDRYQDCKLGCTGEIANLESLSVANSNFPFLMVTHPQNIQCLQLYQYKECKLHIQNKKFHMLKQLLLSSGRTQKQEFVFNKNFQSLNDISMQGFLDVQFNTLFQRLTKLRISKCMMKQLDLKSIKSCFKTFQVCQNPMLEVIKFGSEDTPYFIQQIFIFLNPKLKKQPFQGMPFCKRIFGCLQLIKYQQDQQADSADFWEHWVEMKQFLFKDGHFVFQY